MISLPKILISITTLISTITAAQAPINKDSSKKVVARADIDNGKLHGVLKLQAPNGTVRVHLDVTGLPEEGGPFQYHIHKYAVPSNGDCEATETHFNPYNAPADCSAQQDDSYCQVGDLSGKHGWINTTCFETRYWDPYLSLNPKNKAYPVGLSVNFHFANLTRFACANIQLSKERVDKKDDDEMEELTPLDSDLDFEGQQFKVRNLSVEMEQEIEIANSKNSIYANSSTKAPLKSDLDYHYPHMNMTNRTNGTTAHQWDDAAENSGSKSKSTSLMGALVLALICCSYF